MSHATAASIKTHQQEDATYDYSGQQQQYQNPYQETYTAQSQQNDQQHSQNPNQNF